MTLGGTSAAPRPAETAAFALLLVFAIVMYTVPSEWIPALAPLRLAMISSSLAVGLMVARRLGRREPVALDGVRGWALIAFTCLVAASLGWSIYPEGTRNELGEIAKGVAIYFALVNLVGTRRRLMAFCLTFIFASLVTSVGAINTWRAGLDLVDGFRTHWVGVYGDPNFLAMDLGIVVPLALAFALRRECGLLLRLACAVAAGLAVTAMVLSHSRGGFLGLALSIAVWSFRQRRFDKSVVVGALAVGLLLFAPKSFWQRNETVTDFQEDESAMGRVHAWSVAAAANKDKPLLGTGAGTFQQAWPFYAPPEAARAYCAHNIFIQIIAELGWIGFLLFLVFVSGGLSGALRASTDPGVGWLAGALAASLTGYLVCSFFSGFLDLPQLYVLLGTAAATQRLVARGEATPRPQEFLQLAEEVIA